MAHMIVTAEVFDWYPEAANGRQCVSFERGGPYVVTRECLAEAIRTGKGKRTAPPKKEKPAPEAG